MTRTPRLALCASLTASILALVSPAVSLAGDEGARASEARGAASGSVHAAALAALHQAREVATTPTPQQEEAAFLKRQAALEARMGIQFYIIGEDWRAVTAMQRYQLLAQSKEAAYLSGLIIGQVYHRNDRPELAAISFEQAVLAAPDDGAKVWAYLLETQQICVALNYWGECRWRLDQLAPVAHRMPAYQQDVLRYHNLFNDVMVRRDNITEEDAAAIQDEELHAHALELVAQDRAFDEIRLKRPRLAASMSAVLPGAGQLYNGSYRDAAAAFGLNALFGAATYYSFAELESVPLGIVSSLILVSFYTGNIYNAFTDARQINARRYEAFFADLERKHWPRVGFQIDQNKVQFGVSFDWPGPHAKPPASRTEQEKPGDAKPAERREDVMF